MKTMQKEMVFRSIFRHTLALCLAVPFVGLADGSYDWAGSTGRPGESGFEIYLDQKIENTGPSVNGFSFDQFNKSSFSTDFSSQLGAIDSSLPSYSNWQLSRVIVEISADVSASYELSLTAVQDGNYNTISGVGNPQAVIKIGSFELDASTLSGTKPNSGPLQGTWGQPAISGDTMSYSFSGKLEDSFELSGTDDVSSYLGSGSVSGSAPNQIDDLLVQGRGGTAWAPGTPQTITPTTSSLALTSLTLNIRYVVTPEPGTMALLLTGIPLLLVRRRKSLKK